VIIPLRGILSFFPGIWRARLIEQIASQSSQAVIPLRFPRCNPARDGLQSLWMWLIPPLSTRLVGCHQASLL
jgi:hypothetical protein